MERKQVYKLVSLVAAVAVFFGVLYLTRAENEHFSVKQHDSTELETASATEELIEVTHNALGDSTDSEEVDAYVNPLILNMLAEIERQNQIEEMLIAELDSGVYSLDDPLIIINPYGVSPLTALLLFTTDEPANISVYTPGKSKLADASFTFDGYRTRHQIPVYGLYPGEINEVELSAITRSGSAQAVTIELITEPLPLWLTKDIILTSLWEADNYQKGFNFTFSKKTAFDVDGVYRWFYNDSTTLQVAIYDFKGNIVIAKGSHLGALLMYEINLLGKINRVFFSQFGAHHDAILTETGNLLVSGSWGDTIDDIIYEIDVESGVVVALLDLKRVFQRTRTEGSPEYSAYDWFHHNAIAYNNGNIIISGRHQSTVAQLSWPDGAISWLLSDHVGWNPMYHKYLLTPIGDDFEWCYGQHAVEILPDYDNDPDTVDILVFDNGNSRFSRDRELQHASNANDAIAPELYSRLVHYRINERDMTVEQIWQFGTELGISYYSSWKGDANMLENGNRFGTFDRYNSVQDCDFNTNFIEVDPDGNIVWEAYATSTDSVGGFAAYRCERLPLYTYAANDLRIGVPAINLIPEELLP